MSTFWLPELDSKVDGVIVQENVRAVATMYFVHQHEQMRVFQVVDRVAELFAQGLLPIGRGSAV